ncbi:hypothetical protein [Candidatus Methylocalor cossyra]
MTRLQRIEGLLGALAGRAGVAGCTLASRVGLGGYCTIRLRGTAIRSW